MMGVPPVYEVAEPTAEVLLAVWTAGIEDTHVDSLFYCPWSGGLGYVPYRSAVAEPFYADIGVFAASKTRAFQERGLDPLHCCACTSPPRARAGPAYALRERALPGAFK